MTGPTGNGEPRKETGTPGTGPDDPTAAHPTADDATTAYPTADDPTAAYPTADDPTAAYPTADDPTTVYPTADQPTTAYPTSDFLAGYPTTEYPAPGGYPQPSGPVYGPPGSGPGMPPPTVPPQPGTPPGYPTPPIGYPSPPGFPAPQQPPYGAPGYGYAAVDPTAPFGRDPLTGQPMSDKSKVAAGLLQILLPFLSVCGVGRLYIGSIAIGLVQLLGMFVAIALSMVLIGIPFVIGIWLWTVVDGIMILGGTVRDGQGRVLRS
ncbi:hypothetical protein GCM10023094_27870 [Rhodococcus olei]|uniref:TM2 domain-containing protein n=1 Tax=Rhodococcus olei TaxID=2161675 RepID=A0ABP8P5P6_9NOCA